MASFDVPAETFGAVCIIVDKLDKLPADKVCMAVTRQSCRVQGEDKLAARLTLSAGAYKLGTAG